VFHHVAKSLVAAIVVYLVAVLVVVIVSSGGDEWEQAFGFAVAVLFIGPAGAVIGFVVSLIYRVASAPPKPRPPELPRAIVHSN
jgi:hypothetical protein